MKQKRLCEEKKMRKKKKKKKNCPLTTLRGLLLTAILFGGSLPLSLTMILGVSDVIEGSLPAKAGELFGGFCARRTNQPRHAQPVKNYIIT
jgi:hypothetical protein